MTGTKKNQIFGKNGIVPHCGTKKAQYLEPDYKGASLSRRTMKKLG